MAPHPTGRPGWVPWLLVIIVIAESRYVTDFSLFQGSADDVVIELE